MESVKLYFTNSNIIIEKLKTKKKTLKFKIYCKKMDRFCRSKCSRSFKAFKRRRNILNEECKGLSPRFCRNPFMVFLEHFRKSFKCPYSAYECSIVAANMWNQMDSVEREPYVKFAENFQYTSKPKQSKVIYVMNKIRELVDNKCLDLHTLWRLCSIMGAWNECIMDITFRMDDEADDCTDEDMEYDSS